MRPKVPFASMVSMLMLRQFVSQRPNPLSLFATVVKAHEVVNLLHVRYLLHEVVKHLATVGSAECLRWFCRIHHLEITTQ